MIKDISGILAFAFIGLVSGFINWSGLFFLPEIPVIQQYYPSVILGIFLFLAGRYVAHLKSFNQILSLIILIVFSSIGWRASIEYGHALGGPVPFVNAGIVGALAVAIGWILAWQIRTGIIKLIIIVTLAGALGGGLFQLIDAVLSDAENLWALILFCEWQTILFAAIALAHLHKHKKTRT
jgi:hypothetical protein